ncbi:hypothetical protein GYMLUDRAFT_628375 [Collybiopsis luxurians FD-317 M1]|nr:hypothetical protein GYMLUDRAFT_628375 [Collybiopsis luxurians FD-317 M1]
MFGSTECGGVLFSEGTRKDRRNLLKPFDGTLFKFMPITSSESTTDLLELVVPPEAPDCSDKTLRAEDGDFHTRGHFQEIEPGKYIHCGRSDDWINMENCSLYSAKLTEDNVRELCGSIIYGCAAVGNGCPSPVLIVESDADKVET